MRGYWPRPPRLEQERQINDGRLYLRRCAHAARPRQEGRRAARGDGASARRQVLEAVRDRNGLDTATVDDVIFGCVDPVGEAGRRFRAPRRSRPATHNRAPGMQINRFCASGLDAVNLGAAKIAQGADDIVIAGGVESMSRVGMGMSGGAWAMDPGGRHARLFHAAGRFGRPDRHQIRLLPRRRRRLCGREPEARRAGLGEGLFQAVRRSGEGPATA